MIIGILIVYGLYFSCIILLWFGFIKTPIYRPNARPSKNRFSLVVPFRNESENLRRLLRSIAKLNYPLGNLEIIFVNDFSEDNSVEIIEKMSENIGFRIRVLQNNRRSNSPKKDAILEAIKNAKYDWIASTDADCELPKDWLETMDSFIQTQQDLNENTVMVCGPVANTSNGSFLQEYQFLDGMSLQFATMGSFGIKWPILCNGANLVYQKFAFEEVNGFCGNDQHASGDDVFLLEKMLQTFPGQVRFLKSKEAIVSTQPQNTWENVLQQRIRWGSKTAKLKNPFTLCLGVLVFLVNFSMLAIPLLTIFDFKNWLVWVILFFAKTFLDYLVINQAVGFFGRQVSITNTLRMSFLYALLTTRAVIGSLKGNYTWKGRQYST